MNENINDNGGMFEDVQAMAAVESKELINLRKNYALAEDCIQQLKAELFKVEDERRKEIRQLQTENASMRKALAFTISQLKSYQCKTGVLTRWKNFFRNELTAQEYINAYQEETIDKLKNKLVESIQPGMLGLLNAVRNAPVVNEEPLMLAAETE